MRGPRPLARKLAGLGAAATLVAGSATTVLPASAESTTQGTTQETTRGAENVSSREILFTSDDNGCHMRLAWELCVYFQHGLDSFARVVHEADDPAHVDGSLRMATPGDGDAINLTHTHLHGRGGEAMPFADLDLAGYEVKVVDGTQAPRFSLVIECPGMGEKGYTYAGPTAAQGAGWQTVDVVQGGQALWTGSGLTGVETKTLEEFKTECPTGVILRHGLRLSSPGADTRVDAVRIGDEVTNFWMSPLSRVHHGFPQAKGPAARQRQTANAAAREQFVSPHGTVGYFDDEWANPARPRLPHPRAAVIANPGSYHGPLLGGPLADAVGGPLLLSPATGLHDDTRRLLNGLMYGSSGPVYLVGNKKQLSPRVAAEVREMGLRVVRIGAGSYYGTAVEVARMVERRRPAGAPRTLLLASGKRLAEALPVSAAAGASHGAVLLTRGRTMPAVTRKYVAGQRPARVYAVGREAVAASRGLRGTRDVLAPNPFAMSVKLADLFVPRPTSVVLAGPDGNVDALVAGSVAGRVPAPLLLTRPDGVPPVVARYLSAHRGGLRDSVLVGDRQAVTEPTFARLHGLLSLG